jgi:predicted alpha/beta superfamily hydrolase
MKSPKFMSLGLVILGLAGLSLLISALHPLQTTAIDNVPQVTIPNTELHVVHSNLMQRDYRIYIALPADYATSKVNYPVLYLLDAQSSFATVTEYTRRLSFYKELPQMIVVGVGYTVDSPDDIVLLRARDLTPTDPSGKGQFGWADRFLSFMTDEVVPLVETNYRADTQDRAIVGHSLGGLFGLYTLFTKPETFQRYVVSSPSLWWDQRFMFSYEASFAKIRAELNARLYMSAGALETASDIPIAKEVPEFAAVLIKHAYGGLQLSTHLFEDQTHASVLPMALTDGIRVVYGSN